MKKKIRKNAIFALWTIAAMIVIASCSSEMITETETFVNEREQKVSQSTPPGLTAKDNPAAQNRLLAEIRRHTAKFHDQEYAISEGYVLGSHCVYAEGLGAMGYHYVRPDLVGGGFNHIQPQALLYEPQEDGGMELVGVEYIIVAELWDMGNDEPPKLGDTVFDFMEAKPAGEGLEFDNYQLHVWVWRPNPLGMYFPFNPDVSCEPGLML